MRIHPVLFQPVAFKHLLLAAEEPPILLPEVFIPWPLSARSKPSSQRSKVHWSAHRGRQGPFCHERPKSGIDAQSEIIRGENSVDLETLAAEYHSRFQPATPEERWLVDVLIRSDWQLRRLACAEAQLWRFGIDTAPEGRKDSPRGSILEYADQKLGRLQRRVDSIQRNNQRALRELERLQSRDRQGADHEKPNRDRQGADSPERTQFPQTRMILQPLREPGLHPDSFRLIPVKPNF